MKRLLLIALVLSIGGIWFLPSLTQRYGNGVLALTLAGTVAVVVFVVRHNRRSRT